MKSSDAFRAAWQQQRATAPRRALVKEAFDATRRLPGIRDAPAVEIREALRFALKARGIEHFSDRRLDPLTRAIQTSRTSVLADYALTGLQKSREVAAWLQEHSVPEWMNPPGRAVPMAAAADAERFLGWVELEPRDLPLLTRLLAEAPVPLHRPGEDGRFEPSFPCWLVLASRRDPASAVRVHVGKHVLGRLDAEAAATVRPELVRQARWRRALLAHAELHGSTAERARVRVWLVLGS